MILSGLLKYYNIALVVLLIGAASAAVMYRASYIVEAQRRSDAEDSLQRTVHAFDEYTKSTKAAMDAVTRAANTSRAISDDRRNQREKALKATSDEDGPVASVLRDAVRVRKQAD